MKKVTKTLWWVYWFIDCDTISLLFYAGFLDFGAYKNKDNEVLIIRMAIKIFFFWRSSYRWGQDSRAGPEDCWWSCCWWCSRPWTPPRWPHRPCSCPCRRTPEPSSHFKFSDHVFCIKPDEVLHGSVMKMKISTSSIFCILILGWPWLPAVSPTKSKMESVTFQEYRLQRHQGLRVYNNINISRWQYHYSTSLADLYVPSSFHLYWCSRHDWHHRS